MRKTLPALMVLMILLPARGARQFAPPDLPPPGFYVEDDANVIDAGHERALNGILQELEQKTGVQYIILTVPSTGGLPIEQFSIELLDKWKLGQAGKDNGLLFTLALEQREYRFEVGYGLEGVVTDQYAGRVGRDVLTPYLGKGQYSRGIYEANLRVIRRIADESGVTLTGMPALPGGGRDYNRGLGPRGGAPCFGCPCCALLLILFLAMLLFGRLGRHGGMGWGWLFLLPFLFRGFGGPRRGGPFGGGPFGGGFGGFGGGLPGGFGRFGGGGGGMFGGGGASGRW